MIFLVYSSLSDETIAGALGTADYSYYFVMKRFLPLLEGFGEVVVLEQPPTDAAVARYLSRDRCLLLSFTPPDKLAPVTLCPAVPVFAWEYSSIPSEAFTRPEDNWVDVLRRTGLAITHSGYAAGVVRDQLGAACEVVSIPAPLWDSCGRVRRLREQTPPEGLAGLHLDCTVIDSACYEISNTGVRPRLDGTGDSAQPLVQPWDGDAREYRFGSPEPDLTLIGFNAPEEWGVWSRSGHPWIMLDRTVCGQVELEITVRGYAQNVGGVLGVELGSGRGHLLLSDTLETHRLVLQVDTPSNFLAFSGVERRALDMADPRDLGLGLSHLAIRRPPAEPPAGLQLDFTRDDPALVLEGFHACEPVGRWTAARRCLVHLPAFAGGDYELRLELFHLVHNDGREIEVRCGGCSGTVVLQAGVSEYRVGLAGLGATDFLLLDHLGLGPGENAGDHRQLGLGVRKISLVPAPAAAGSASSAPARRVPSRARGRRSGILYTAILNPHDGRKNWEDIITAFVYAFRDTPHATLLVKITSHDLARFFEDIFGFFTELHPFRCRLVFIHGYLDYGAYEQLMVHSHFIVNASRGEGQCLPLMEFMSCGVPAIAPANTAMLDYLDRHSGFVVRSDPELTHWPHDPRQVFRTLWQRIDWQSLYQAFRDSERTWRSGRAYRRMSRAAIDAQEAFCSLRVARERLGGFLDQLEDRP